MTIMAQMEKELGGELAQMYELLLASVANQDKDGATQVYSMILWHIAHKHNASLVEALDQMLNDL